MGALVTDPDPLAAVLAEALRQEVAGVEPTITCTPDEEKK